MLSFCDASPVILVIDDLKYVDKWSWDLLFSLHKNGRSLLLVLATEPMNRSYMAALETKPPRVRRIGHLVVCDSDLAFFGSEIAPKVPNGVLFRELFVYGGT